MKKTVFSQLPILLLAIATVTGARPIKLPPPPPAVQLPLSFWLSLFTVALR
jgi:hypothetical protein